VTRPPIVIAGVGQVGPVAQDSRSIAEFVLEAVEMALDDAGITHRHVEAVVTASVDLLDGLTASNIAVTEVVDAVMKPETRVSMDGLAAAIHAACQIRAGAYETVLVVAHAKPSMAPYEDLSQWAMDPIYLQPLGIDFLVCAALQAQAIANGDGAAERRWAEIAATRRTDARPGLCPPLGADDVLASPVVASPLRREMCAPMGDGACAAILQAVTDRNMTKTAPRITGLGHDLAPHSLGDREIRAWQGLKRASKRAYAMAGINTPQSAFDLVEPSCLYPHEEELFRSATGIGDQARFSPTGGLFAGHTPVVAGLSRLVAACSAMRADDSCKRALAHGAWGPAGQGQAVMILETGER